ncbi:hypothetical protein DRW07_04625 [Alteromonas sediminis]|uniref:Uncharacterized protein n=1 Tax=Alteromonas sediminis TaxID=2259342 RepID=A0A3N5YFB2_9ALTE|nr:hypothetical protein [Alteromonas sediminis]RPJ68685.1 hypothetical protein DRW07_04625 [Alteromonas sediminis]
MANTPKNDDFPTIRLDDEDRRDYQQKKHAGTGTPAQHSQVGSASQSKGGFPVVATFSLLIALGASGAAYYLYDLSLKQAATNQAAEARIADLERRLSATGEEMGESTVALQVKVTELSEKTTELWDQMDKLWASAWRRNQKEIADLTARVGNVQNNLQESINQVSRNTNSQQTKLGAIETQLSGIADEMLALNVQIEQSLGDRQSFEQQNKNLQDQLSVIEQRNAALSGRITQLENEMKSMATKLVSQPASVPAAGSPTQ